jgi:predicted transcriptional regulator
MKNMNMMQIYKPAPLPVRREIVVTTLGDGADPSGQGAGSQEKPDSQRHHAQKTVHGKGSQAENYLELVPTPDTPGFATISARAVQASLALLAHARQHGAWMDRTPDDPHLAILAVKELSAFWTVGGLAHALGVNRNTAGAALQELVDYGWVRKSQGRHAGGQFRGFAYALRAPSALTEQARFKIHKRLKKKGVEYREFEGVAGRYLDEREIKRIRAEIEDELADEHEDGPEQETTDAIGVGTSARHEAVPTGDDGGPALAVKDDDDDWPD